jgi:hypothetical protein
MKSLHQHPTFLEHTPIYSTRISTISCWFVSINCLFSFSPFPSLQRYNTNPAISTTKPNPPPTYTYKDYQSASINNPRRNVEHQSEPEPLTSIYTFPSLIKPNNNWRAPQSQPSTIDGSSSAWRLFGVHRLLH